MTAKRKAPKRKAPKRAAKVDTPRPATVLVLRANADGPRSHGGFLWPESGPVEAPDWNPVAECGKGLHGLLWGEGDRATMPDNAFRDGSRWLVVEVLAADVVDLRGKVKFPRGEVVFCGDRYGATAYMAERAPGRAIVSGTATAGDRGTATAGHSGTATAGDSGTATAGHSGTATAGPGGTATAGIGGTIAIRYWDGAANRCRIVSADVGDNGILPNVAYVVRDRKLARKDGAL
jgi:hypothetical protein